jgi:hypothetical protein
MATGAAPEPAGPRKLSHDLESILREFAVETVTLREIMAVLDGRGYMLLVMLLALPFITPIPLPGLSTPFGLVIALIGMRLALGLKPWLPARLLDRPLSPKLFARVFAAARKVIRGFELFLKPRLPWLTGSPVRLQLHALPIFLSALLLLLPLPVPFSNLLPALSILLIAAGLLERDGLFIVAGHAAFAGAVVFFVFLALAGAEGFDAFRRWMTG